MQCNCLSFWCNAMQAAAPRRRILYRKDWTGQRKILSEHHFVTVKLSSSQTINSFWSESGLARAKATLTLSSQMMTLSRPTRSFCHFWRRTTLPWAKVCLFSTKTLNFAGIEWSFLTNEHRSTNKYFFLVWENPKSFLESLQRLWWRIMVFRCARIPPAPLHNIEKVFRKFIFNPYCDLFTNKCWSVFECVLCTGIWMKVNKPFQCNYDDNEDRLILKNFGGGFLVKNICNILGERDPPLFDRQ